MRVLDSQVHVFELLAVAVACFMGYAMGYSLPILAMIFLLLWPLLVLQMVAEGVFWGLVAVVRRLWRGPEPDAPEPPPPLKRHGAARFLWMLPFVAIAVGYVVQYIHTGTWFL